MPGQAPPFDHTTGTPASIPAAAPNGQGFYSRGRGQGGGGNRSGNHRRRRGNTNSSQPTVPKYGQAAAAGTPYAEGDSDFQPKLPSDTAPAFRFVEKRPRRGKGSHHRGPNAGPAASGSGPPPTGQNGNRPAFPQEHHAQQHHSQRQENAPPARPIRILHPPPRTQLPGASDASAAADIIRTDGSAPVGEHHGAGVNTTITEEAAFSGEDPGLKEEERPSPNIEQQGPGSSTRKFAGIVFPLPEDHQQTPPRELTMEEAIHELSIRELLDTSDVIEPLPKLKHHFEKTAFPGPFTPAANRPDTTSFSSPLTITQTPINPNIDGNGAQHEETPVERFLKIADVTSRYMTERLNEITYNPDLSHRLKADFEVLNAAYNALPFDQGLNPHRVIHNTLTSLKRCLEQRNHDAKVLGALKHMTQTYDMIRTQAIHERWLKGEQAVSTAGMRERYQLGCIAIARSGENLVDTLKWNIRGGDMHVQLFKNDAT
ncbi:hypothetical protein TWF696_004727 [Orbilia brochopaga]|uniref:Uncharacterized protein n=1 Tax=Orbilia brochopaga TaxID=3140254 RepID=A0AAV9UZC9_9PEZI